MTRVADENFAKIGVDMYRAIEAMGTTTLKTATEQLRLDQQNQERLTQEKLKLIEREVQASRTQQNWEQATRVLEYVGYISMFVSAYNVTGAAGHVLRVLAAAGLLNRFADDTGLKESVLQHFIQTRQAQEQIQSTMHMLGIASSLGAVLLIWKTSPVDLPNLHQLAASMESLSGLVGIATQAASLGGKWAERRRLFIQADLKQFESLMQIGAKEFQERMQGVERTNKTLQGAVRSANNIVHNATIQPMDE